MAKEDVIVRFENVTFRYSEKKPILEDVNFSVRENSKITIMGQNGAGKSTIFKLISGKLKPEKGQMHIKVGAKIGIAHQMIHKSEESKTLKGYFESAFTGKVYGIEKNIKEVLQAVNLEIDINKKVKELSGGQKARLLLAFALIQNPDILLLDEPTNNLDQEGIDHLTAFLIMYPKTCIVISHDANFLNCFTEGVLNLGIHTHKIEQFVGNYFDVVEQIEAHIEKERLLNARIQKSIKDRFEMVNRLGGKSVAMRRLANRVREDIEEDREKMVEVRREDRTIPEFKIPYQHCKNPIIRIKSVEIIRNGEVVTKSVNKELNRGSKILISGPNGIGKSTLLGSFLNGKNVELQEGLRIGYYSQDFSELNFRETAFDSLKNIAARQFTEEEIYATAARFLLNGSILHHEIESLSEGQKGLLCYARFILQEPGLLIMDEPTNHINFRHIPIIAKALNDFEGALILVSHLSDFVSQVSITDEVDLTKLK